jgi:hypothetical protein
MAANDRVRETLVRVLGTAHSPDWRALLDALGINGIAAPSFVAERLLASPAPEPREAVPPQPSGAVGAIERVMQGYADAYPTDVWPETPFSDAQAASVMRLMVPRIREALLAAVRGERGEPKPWMRVKVAHEMVEALAKESAPVTFRVNVEHDGDLMLIATRHDCAGAPNSIDT